MKKSASAIVSGILLVFASESYAGGMPADTLDKVKKSIASKYPDNYSLQKILIDGQKESYDFLENYAPSSIPPDVLEKIKNNIVSKYPDNYSLQKTLIEAQVKSYLDLNK
jgi:hypothetical protein